MKPGDLVKLSPAYISIQIFEGVGYIPGVRPFREEEVGVVLEITDRMGVHNKRWVKIISPEAVGWCDSETLRVIE